MEWITLRMLAWFFPDSIPSIFIVSQMARPPFGRILMRVLATANATYCYLFLLVRIFSMLKLLLLGKYHHFHCFEFVSEGFITVCFLICLSSIVKKWS